jgi:hypothetical protein
MNGRQLGSILIAYIAIETAMRGLAGVAAMPKFISGGPPEVGHLWLLVLVSFAATLVFAIGPAALLLSLRGRIEPLFNVGEARVGGVSVAQLAAALLLFVGVEQVLVGLLAIPTSLVAAQAAAWGLEQTVGVGVSTVQLLLGAGLVLRGRRIAEWWAGSTSVAA